jgi:hypothetical protein
MARGEDMDNTILDSTQRQIMGTNKNAIKIIATNEDWKNDSNGRVA